MEQARSGYDLLKQLQECSPEDLDTWNGLMQRWTATNAEIVLNELEQRLRLIKRLLELVDSPKADELHDLQPLFERGLWMFGVEYEAIDFRSNRGLSTIVRDFLGGTDKQLPRCRPDFVALPDRSIGVYGAAAYEDEGEVSGLRKVLVVELKKGGFSLTQKEVNALMSTPDLVFLSFTVIIERAAVAGHRPPDVGSQPRQRPRRRACPSR